MVDEERHDKIIERLNDMFAAHARSCGEMTVLANLTSILSGEQPITQAQQGAVTFLLGMELSLALYRALTPEQQDLMWEAFQKIGAVNDPEVAQKRVEAVDSIVRDINKIMAKA